MESFKRVSNFDSAVNEQNELINIKKTRFKRLFKLSRQNQTN